MYLVIFSIVFIIVYYSLARINYYRKYKTPPQYPGRLPLIGHLHFLLGKNQQELWTMFRKMMRQSLKFGGVMNLSMGTHHVFLVTDPDDAKTVANLCLDKINYYELAKSWFGSGLATADVPTWKKHRKFLNHSFTHQTLVGFLGIFNRNSRSLLSIFDTHIGRPFDPQALLIESDLKVICQTTAGFNPETHKELLANYTSNTVDYWESIFKRFIRFWLHIDIIFSLSTLKKKHDKIVEDLHHCTNTMLHMRKIELAKATNQQTATGSVKPMIMDLMLESGYKDKLFTDDEIRSELDTILFAGHDTTATTLAFILLLIGSDTAVQEKAYKEVLEVFGDSDKDLDNSDINKLVYLEAIIKETIRLYPVGPAVGRVAVADVKLKNYTIPAGRSIIIGIWGIHRHSLWGDDPDAFWPDRWLDPATLPDFQKASFGFSWGKRGCIGKTYAMMSMKITLAHFIRRFTVRADVNQLTLKMEALLKPMAGNEITIELRKS